MTPEVAGKFTYSTVSTPKTSTIKEKPGSKKVEILVDGKEIALTPNQLLDRVETACFGPEPLEIMRNPYLRYTERYLDRSYGGVRTKYILVTEAPPGVRTVRYDSIFDNVGLDYEKGGVPLTAQVSMPYLVNVFPITHVPGAKTLELDVSRVMAFYRNSPLSDINEDKVQICNLPNVRLDPWNDSGAEDAYGWVCYLNTAFEFYIQDGTSVEQALELFSTQLMNYMLESEFTPSAGSFTAWKETAASVESVSTFERWAENTKQNPHFGLTVPWLDHPKNRTLRQILNAIKNKSATYDSKQIVKARKELSPHLMQKILSGKAHAHVRIL